MNDDLMEKGVVAQPEKLADIPNKSYKERFLEKWNKEDARCPTCNHTTKIERGITKQNLKRLVWGPPNVQDWLTLIMLVGILLMAYSYNGETTECKNVVKNLDKICIQYCSMNAEIAVQNQQLKDAWINKSVNLLFVGNITET